MSIVSFERRSASGLGPMRSAFAQSTVTRTRSLMSAGTSRARSSNAMKPYSRGTGPSPERYMTASLPSCRSARVIARSEPSESPSGFSWLTTTKRSFLRVASATAARSVVVWGELIDEVCHAHAALDRRIVLEGQLRGPLHSQLAREPALEHPVRCGQPLQRRLALAGGTEDADVHGCVPQVRRRVDAGDGDEADARVLELRQRLGEHLPERLVHPAHPFGHGGLVWQGSPRERGGYSGGPRRQQRGDDAAPEHEERDGRAGEHGELPALVERAGQRDGGSDD